MTKRELSLLEDPSTPLDVRELLQAGRDSHVVDYDYNAGLSRHMAAVQAGAPLPEWAKGLEGGAGTGSAVTAAAGSGLLGWLALPVVTAAVVAAVVMLRADEPATPDARTPASDARIGSTASPQAPSPITGAPAVVARSSDDGAPSAGERAANAESAQRAARNRPTPAGRNLSNKRVAVPAGTRPSGTAATGGTAPRGASANADSFRDAPAARSDRAATVRRDTPVATANAAQASRVAPQPPQAQAATTEEAREDERQPVEQAAPAMDDTRLEREMGMLSVAQRVLHSDPARTLSLARQGEAEFAGSMFTQERQQLELLALVKLGRLDEAKRLARPYLARYPNGPFSDRVRRALATGRVER